MRRLALPLTRPVLVAVALAGCDIDVDSPDAIPPPLLPRFEPQPCRYPLGAGQEEGVTASCGDLIVPARRDVARNAAELRLHVVRFGGPRPAEAPIVWLEGGPGGDIARVAGLPLAVTETITGARDFIVFTQRGTGRATPGASCAPELAGLGTSPDPAAEQAALDQALDACRDRLIASGVELAGLSTPANADDVDDLRSTLGYAQLNLLGGSYGTRLAQEVLRRHPTKVRAALLDAVAPSSVPWMIRGSQTFQSALTAQLDRCAADATCKAAFGGGITLFANAYAALDGKPLALANGAVILDARRLTGLVFELLYTQTSAAYVPLVLDAAQDRNAAVLEATLAALPDSDDEADATGMYWSIVCQDFGRFLTTADVMAAYSAVRAELVATFQRRDLTLPARCAGWPLAAADPGLTEPVTSEVPTLLVSGGVDPITPADYGATVAQTLTRARHVVFPAGAHGNALDSECGVGLTRSFFAKADAAALDLSCAADVQPPPFATQPPTANLQRRVGDPSWPPIR